MRKVWFFVIQFAFRRLNAIDRLVIQRILVLWED
jgi:hypothetical protein